MDFPVLARIPDGTACETDQHPRIDSAATVIARRSVTCGQECAALPCTLAQIRAAQRATVTDPRITLWSELAVIAHLTGWTMPKPAAEFSRDLRAMTVRLRDCTFSAAVGDAVASRAPAFSSRVSPDSLAAHVVAAMRESVTTGRWLCERDEPRYLAPAYQWAIVHDALKLAYRGTGQGRHPQSADWERQYGQVIPGDTCARQFGTVNRWYDRDQQNRDALTAIAWGTRTRTAIEQAVGTTRSDEQWNRRLTDLLEAFGNPRWPHNYLRRRAPVHQSAGVGA